ncbi:hypothetical protein RvY_08999-1 [Ramazzottius varieornatus]|uniref:Neurotransmitter-gated ion-channel ligand-binding domain-containing protein n=1 Tax=Ramazzottius varieornatus TaxID=947166 RepID=A0A1D1V7T3_RAMVA|nr:hypothetical protein RvY_08999-1 [Ramazzottius varieornatus]
MTKATLHPDGLVIWEPPAIYKSSCSINVQYFPFDIQDCTMKLCVWGTLGTTVLLCGTLISCCSGSWTYDGFQVDLKHIDEVSGTNLIRNGIDLMEYYPSVEWEIIGVPAIRNEKFYPCCAEPYPDITFNVTIRRKTLFYTVNLIIPCVAISFLTVLVFYLPSASGEKVGFHAGISSWSKPAEKSIFVGDSMYLHSSVTDRVLPPSGRDYSSDLSCRSSDREVPIIHNGSRNIVHCGHSGRKYSDLSGISCRPSP